MSDESGVDVTPRFRTAGVVLFHIIWGLLKLASIFVVGWVMLRAGFSLAEYLVGTEGTLVGLATLAIVLPFLALASGYLVAVLESMEVTDDNE